MYLQCVIDHTATFTHAGESSIIMQRSIPLGTWVGGHRKKERTNNRKRAPINRRTQPGVAIISDRHLHNGTRSPIHSHERNKLSFLHVIIGFCHGIEVRRICFRIPRADNSGEQSHFIQRFNNASSVAYYRDIKI